MDVSFEEDTSNANQACKYNGKELDRMHVLDWYDYGARNYDAALPVWTTVDPLAEKYFSVSPYVYVANNPIRNVDFRGDSITTVVTSTVNGVTSNTTYNYGQKLLLLEIYQFQQLLIFIKDMKTKIIILIHFLLLTLGSSYAQNWSKLSKEIKKVRRKKRLN